MPARVAPAQDYTRYLDPAALKGLLALEPAARVLPMTAQPAAGRERSPLAVSSSRAGEIDGRKRIAILQATWGAIIVDPVDIPSIVTTDPDHNFLLVEHLPPEFT